MGLSKYIIDIIELNHAIIVSDIPFKDLLVDFRSAHILTSTEVKQLQKYDDHKTAGFEFLEILKSRDDKKFFAFCEILKSSYIDSIKIVGQNLEEESYKMQGWSSFCMKCYFVYQN